MQVGEAVVSAVLARVAAPAAVPRYHMHVDAGRTGAGVDADWRRLAAWRWGRGGRGAVVPCNNDSDDATASPDHADGRVNGGNDADENGGRGLPPRRPRPAGVVGRGSSRSRTRRTRGTCASSDGRAAGASEILGPAAGARHRFPTLAFTELTFGMEALRYAGTGFAGLVTLTFTIEDGGRVIYSQRAALRVAPWMMPNHSDRAEKV
jgi:hypothetical protein